MTNTEFYNLGKIIEDKIANDRTLGMYRAIMFLIMAVAFGLIVQLPRTEEARTLLLIIGLISIVISLFMGYQALIIDGSLQEKKTKHSELYSHREEMTYDQALLYLGLLQKKPEPEEPEPAT